MNEVYETADYFYIVFENIQGQDLFTYCEDRDFRLKEPLVSFILSRLLSAVHYLHSHGILHRNLTLPNVLMTSSLDSALPKLADFTSAMFIGSP